MSELSDSQSDDGDGDPGDPDSGPTVFDSSIAGLEEGDEGSFYRRQGEAHREESDTGGTQTFQKGSRIGPFVLRRFLARGGMGQVWVAKDTELRRTVALKLVLPDRVEPRMLELFSREARAGGRAAHKNLVTTLAYGSDEGLSWIAQELVEGSWTLKDFLDEMRASDKTPKNYYRNVADFVAQVADGLHAAHEAGVIHRDIKPQNILIAPDNSPKVTDFGLARVTGDSFLSHSGDFAGTWSYMSPEQVTAKRMGLDHRSDIFSLGIVLYEMLTLRRPFEGDTTHQIAEKIIAVDPPDPTKIRSQCPAELAVICGKALEKAPGQRYATSAEFAADLRRHMTNRPILAKSPSVLQRATKWARRNPTTSVAGAVAVVAFTVITYLLIGISGQRNDLKLQADTLRESLKERDAAKAKTAEELARALKAERLAEERAYVANLYVAQFAINDGRPAEAKRALDDCPEDLRGWEWDHLYLTQDQSLHSFRGHERAVTSVAWSPDGTRIVSGSKDKTLRIWDPDNNVPSMVLRWQGAQVNLVDWNDDGTKILAGSEDGQIAIWDAESARIVKEIDAPDGEVQAVSWSPNGSRIASMSSRSRLSSTSSLQIWDVETDKRFVVDLGGLDFTGSSLAWDPTGSKLVSSGNSSGLVIWDASTGERLNRLRDGRGITSVAWNAAGTQIASGNRDGTIQVWDSVSGKILMTLVGHQAPVRSVAWNPVCLRLVSGSSDCTLRIWDGATGETIQTLYGHQDEVLSVSWNPSGSRIASASVDKTIRSWDVDTGESVGTFERPRGAPLSNRVRGSFQDSPFRIVGLGDGVPIVWDPESGNVLQTLDGYSDVGIFQPMRDLLVWDPAGSRIAVGTRGGSIRIWNAELGEHEVTLVGHNSESFSIAWSPEGDRIVSSSVANKTLQIWDLDSGRRSQFSGGPESVAWSLAWDSIGSRIAVGYEDGTIRVLDIETGKTISTFEGPSKTTVRSIAWSSDCARLVSGGERGALSIWDVRTGELLLRSTGHEGSLESVSWSLDDTRIVSGSTDGTLRIWDSEAGVCLLTLKGHHGAVTSVDFDPDGSRIFGLSLDGTLGVWDSHLDEALTRWHAAAMHR